MEAAKAWGYRWSDWQRENEYVKAKVMAHELHKGMREAYQWEQSSREGSHGEAESAGRTGQDAPWDKIRNHFMGSAAVKGA